MVLYYNRYFYTYRKENEQTLELRTKEFRNDRKTTYSHPNCKSDHTHPPHFHTHPPHHISQYTIISVFSLQCYRTPPATQKRRAIWPRPKFNIQILHSLAEWNLYLKKGRGRNCSPLRCILLFFCGGNQREGRVACGTRNVSDVSCENSTIVKKLTYNMLQLTHVVQEME